MKGPYHVIIWLVMGPFLLFSSPKKILPEISNEILNYTLFNYDNLIADHYEDNHPYRDQLIRLLHKGTNCPVILLEEKIVKSDDLANEADPVKYMVLLNSKTKSVCNYYFEDN
ncbi:hypothetical protein DID80_04980 [Candidatus Marinamargulisbacteria bacterium SCGC AAA071-K20]|nr:hypothetical protein DID80_04980 [Candidatus Marinamargulisbacteria bacterium SCGC AAA071-K20]